MSDQQTVPERRTERQRGRGREKVERRRKEGGEKVRKDVTEGQCREKREGGGRKRS